MEVTLQYRSLMGHNGELKCMDNITIKQLRKLIEEKTGVVQFIQLLMHKGEEVLNDDFTMKDYKMDGDDFINISLKLRGD